MKPIYIPIDEAKRLRALGNMPAAETLSAQRPTTFYSPEVWESDRAKSRLEYYQKINAINKTIYKPSLKSTEALVLSFESIIRRYGYVAFPIKRDYWSGRISHRVTERFLSTLIGEGLLIRRKIQVSKRADVYDASPALRRAIPPLPPGEREGKLRSDQPWQPVLIKTLQDLDDTGVPRSMEEQIAEATAEIEDLNHWYSAEADRIEGVDDLRFHRVFHHNLHLGGRLYGQFTSMDRELQRPRVRIDGEETAHSD